MPRSGYKKVGISERVSMVAEILLEGAMRIMEKTDEKPNEEVLMKSKTSSQRGSDMDRPSTGMPANPI